MNDNILGKIEDMKVNLYTDGALEGRCALLAKDLSKLSVLYGSEAIMAAKELFIGNYSQQSPLELKLNDEEQLEKLKEVCREFNIKYNLTP